MSATKTELLDYYQREAEQDYRKANYALVRVRECIKQARRSVRRPNRAWELRDSLGEANYRLRSAGEWIDLAAAWEKNAKDIREGRQ